MFVIHSPWEGSLELFHFDQRFSFWLIDFWRGIFVREIWSYLGFRLEWVLSKKVFPCFFISFFYYFFTRWDKLNWPNRFLRRKVRLFWDLTSRSDFLFYLGLWRRRGFITRDNSYLFSNGVSTEKGFLSS